MDKFKYLLILFFVSQSLFALTTLRVSLSSDNNPGGMGEVGDLRYCLNTMNEQLNTTPPDDYAIVFDFPMTIQLNGLLPIINNSSNPVNITIGNPGSIPTVTIDGNGGAYSGFFIPMGNVTIQNMIFQNMTAKGGNGGDGISGGGGGLGAGGAIYVPQTFLNGSYPSVTLMNVSINNCSAVGGNGGNYFNISSPTGNEGGGGGGGFSGNGGSVITTGITGGAGGGGFGGNGGDVTLSMDFLGGAGGGGGGGLGSRATLGLPTNLGNGGSDQENGQDGNGFGLNITAGSGGGGNTGGNNAGGGGGGSSGSSLSGGGGGGSAGSNGLQPQGSTPPLRNSMRGSLHKPTHKPVIQIIRELNALLHKSKEKTDKNLPSHGIQIKKLRESAIPSGGNGGNGAGGGGGGVVITSPTNEIDGQSGSGGYGGGGGGGAGTGAYDVDYTVQGGLGGMGGGGGGGGVNQSGSTPAQGGDSLGGGGGGGGGPSYGVTALGGADTGLLGGGSGGEGANTYGSESGGGGGGGGSGLGGAIFVDSGLNFTIQALSGIPTNFNTANDTIQSGTGGQGGFGGSNGLNGSALGNSIFLRTGSSLTLRAEDPNDILTLGDQVSFTDDTNFGGGGTIIFVRGNGTVIYNGTSDYQGSITVNNTIFKVNGEIDNAAIFVCRDNVLSPRGILSGTGTLTGSVFANSGAISPDSGGTLTLGSLTLNPAAGSSLGSVVHVNINAGGTSLVAVTGPTSLAGALEINLEANAIPGQYTFLTSSGITGTFDSVIVTSATGKTPNYTLSYLPVGAPTYVQLNFLGFQWDITVDGSVPLSNPIYVRHGRPIILGSSSTSTAPITYSSTSTGGANCQIRSTETQTFLKIRGFGSCTIIGTQDGETSNPLTVIAS